MGKIFGILGLLAGVAVMLIVEVPVMRELKDQKRYAAVYGTILALFLLVSLLQIFQMA